MTAHERIQDHCRRTPLLTLHEYSTDRRAIQLKLESLQRTGSFKARGALNYALANREDARSNGMTTVSAGNHALGVLLAARIVGTTATIFLPEAAGEAKVRRLRDELGADQTIQRVGEEYPEAEQAAHDHARATGSCFVHPFDDPMVRAGQGTVAREIHAQDPDVDFVIVPVGGGGLGAGIARFYDSVENGPELFGAQDATNATLGESLQADRPVSKTPSSTVADGLATGMIAETNFRALQSAGVQSLTVSEQRIEKTMDMIKRETNTNIEGAGAVSLAAALSCSDQLPSGQGVCIISGGNA